ncbi:polyketide synthase [Metarhizium album ARSEF 1941]|uniref:Polyketide synthase n=1 Tax=Metarhizium album (strain ARSEF 1941) TaxID=1081103 RepID=A0A0B2WEL0_METAS|nr:polyketide synthase [Metarhizium album ARSEF 1941]KHN94261.1 polyketide synthase [Metarhizium album ARSEF 1941]
MDDDIAVIGLGLRFPGEATNPESLWKVLEAGESQWSEIPKERLNVDGYYHPSGDRQGSISFKGAHLLKGDIRAFDATFFSIPSEDARAIDPQQRMLLEVSYEALENAGLKKEDVYGSDTSVYVGSFVKDYEQVCLRDPDWSPQYAATGNGIAIMANRISYFFNFHGPSVTVDTGCSGSLVSVHLGAQSLRNRESSLAIAAGAGMILTPSTMMPMTALNFLSPDGKCFTFDKRANGYGRGEGIGVVVMKRLSDALRDNDTIRAVIRGTSINQDGRTTGITLPSKEAQMANIRTVYKSAGLDFDQTAYVECHGTGTQAGDWRELKAISETLAADRDIRKPIVVGSIKPNIGHLEGAAGVAGLIKGVMVLEKGKIPPNINFQSGNPDINFESWRVRVPTAVMDWPNPGLRRVSVNCFGFGGTNAHAILDEAPEYLLSRGLVGNHSSVDVTSSSSDQLRLDKDATDTPENDEYQLFCYSAHERGGVSRIMGSHSEYIKAQAKTGSRALLRNYSYTLACRRSVMEWKGFVVAKSMTELAAKLETAGSSKTVRSSSKGQPRIGFVFSGQGTQWAKMGQDLMEFAVFRDSLEDACEYLLHSLQSPFNLIREIMRDEPDSDISYPHIAQPATTAIQVALVDLLRSFGVSPTSIIGHSSGEIAAAYAGGAISRFHAWEIAYFRGLAAISMPIRAPKLKGAMMVLGMSVDETQKYLEDKHLSAEIACVNSPASTTISGRVEAIEAIAQGLDEQKQKTFHRTLKVRTAYHSSHMRLVEHDYRDSLVSIEPRALQGQVQMFSSVTGKSVRGEELGPRYWSDNMVNPVQYVAALTSMMEQPVESRPEILIEIGPRAALRSPTAETMASFVRPDSIPKYYSVMQPKTNGVLKVLGLVGDLWTEGYCLNMEQVVSRGEIQRMKCLSNLPPYPWNHDKSYWHESHLSVANRNREYPRQDLIGAMTADSTPFEPRWRGFLRVSENPWIQDHQVQKTIVYPAAGMISMVLEGAKQIRPEINGFLGYEISGMHLSKAMMVPNTEHGLEVALNIKITTDISGQVQPKASHQFSIYSKHLGRDWEQHATGLVQFKYSGCCGLDPTAAHDDELDKISSRCKKAINSRQLYEDLDTIGMNYGQTFQNVSNIYKGQGVCVCKVSVPDTKSKMPAKFEYPHIIHPATLDSMFHPLFAIETVPMVPNFIESLFVSTGIDQDGPKLFSGFATAKRVGLQGASAKIVMNGYGAPKSQVIVNGLHLTAIHSVGASQDRFLPNFRNLCTEIVWREDAAFDSSTDLTDQICILAHKFPGLAVLQVGGTSENATQLLQDLALAEDDAPRLSKFTLLERKDSDAFKEVMETLKESPVERFIERKTAMADVNSKYHLIISYGRLGSEVKELKDRLKVGGVLMQARSSLRNHSAGANGHSDEQDSVHSVHPIVYRRPAALLKSPAPPLILLAPEHATDEISAFVELVKSYQTKSAQEYQVWALNSQEILSHGSLVERSVILSLLDVCPSLDQHHSIMQWDEFHFNLFKDIQRASKGMIWLTRGAHMNPRDLQGSSIIGLARTLMSEDPRKVIVTFDLDVSTKTNDKALVNNIMTVFSQTFCEEAASDYPEMEFAEKDGKVFIPRLRTIQGLNRIIEGNNPSVLRIRPFHNDQTTPGSTLNVKLSIVNAGLSNDSWHYTEFPRTDILPDEVEIRFSQTLLVSQDVETVLGRDFESSIGLDVRGTITRIGRSVTEFLPGDEVVGLVSGGSIQSTVKVRLPFIQRRETSLFPSQLISAYYAIVHMGRGRPGKSAFVHAGASAYGLAAIAFARMLGVKVYTTVVGPDPDGQRKILEGCGLTSDTIFSAEGDFVPHVLSMTDGKGVDILCSTARDDVNGVEKCVKDCGVIVRLLGGSPYSIGRNFGSTSRATVVNFDLRRLLREDADFVAELLESSSELLGQKHFDDSIFASTAQDFSIESLDKALKYVQAHPYQGLCTVSAGSEEDQRVHVLCDNDCKSLNDVIDPEGTYLLAGGLGGLGRSIAELLTAHGAKHLAFVSRSGTSNSQARAFVEDLQNRGADAKVYQADLCDMESLSAVIKSQVSVQMPPIRGVFQCAAVIQDSVFDNMTYQMWNAAYKPKTQGSWNLVKTTADLDSQPFFIFLASSAGVIGNRGQANYAAGNSFKDALAHHCRLRGVPAVSIDLGPVLGAGMLAGDDDMLDKLRAAGFYGIRHDDFLTVVKHAITMDMGHSGGTTPAQVILGVGTGGLLRQNKPADPYWSRTALYSHLNLIDVPPPDLDGPNEEQGANMKTLLARCSSTEGAVDLIRLGLSNMLAKATNLLPEEVDVDKPPSAYGVDSLVAVGVRNWVLSNCNVEVSVFEVLSNDTIMDMARMIATRGGYEKA